MSEHPLLPRLFSEDLVENYRLVLVVNKEINDASWGAWFPEVQKAFRERVWKENPFSHCHINFCTCEWADPLPLLSLIISLNEFEQNGGTVSLEFLPRPTREQSQDRQYSKHSRLLKFMANEGFLQILWKQDVEPITGSPVEGNPRERGLLIGNEQLTPQILADLMELPVSLAFERSTCLPATLVLVHSPKDDEDRVPFDAIDQWAERKLLEVIGPVVTDMTPGWAQRGLRYRLLMLLRECLHNVAEHAYSKSGLAAVYIRYREGALGEAPETWGRLRSYIGREYVSWRVPLMGTRIRAESFPETRPGFFEFFVVDSGVGLCRSLGDCPQKDASDPVHQCMREVFVDGRSRKDPDRPTRYGGLYLVRQLLESHHDYVRIRDEDTWWGTTLPLPVTAKGSILAPGQFAAKSEGKRHTGCNVSGLAWTARLSWLEPTDDPDRGTGWYGPDTESCIDTLLNTFNATEVNPNSPIDLPVCDHRFRHQHWNNLDDFKKGKQSVLLLLPQPDQMKNHIQEVISETIGPEKYDVRMVSVRNETEMMDTIKKFKKNTESQKHICTVLVACSAGIDDKCVIATHNDEGKFNTKSVSGVNDTLLMEVKKKDINRQRLVKLVASRLGRTPPRTEALLERGIVVIGDIVSEEAATYLAALVRARKLSYYPFTTIQQIILITRRLRVTVLSRGQEGTFNLDESAAELFIQPAATKNESPDHSLADYYKVLRHYDGSRLWKTVMEMPDAYIPEQVYWNENTVLDGFLDFSQTITHPLCRDIYSITLQRLMGLFPQQDCELIALDSLVESLVVRFNATRHPRQYNKQKRSTLQDHKHCLIQIGSVQVTGLTEFSEQRSKATLFHFFRHYSGTATGYYLLPWRHFPSQKALLGAEDLPSDAYRRVGRTPVVARHGWKAFPVPRFNKQEDCIYEQCPRNSYRAWQEPSRTPMKLGHWSYGGHHDLLTLNLLFAFDTELDRISMVLGGSLARFVYANLFRVFGLTEKNLNPTGKEISKAIQKDERSHPYRHVFSDKLVSKNPILVYPAHPVTDHVMDRFLSLIAEVDIERIRSRIHAVLPIRRHRSGSGLQTSGLVQDRLRTAIPRDRRKKPPPVVFFDDALISGRTYEEIKRLMHSLGFSEVYSLFMLDRQRLPSADHVDGKTHLCYWRLDVPSMGSQTRCPLCHAIQRVIDFRNNLTSDVHQQRVEAWIRIWSPVNPATQWGDSGLRPIPLTLNKYERRFGLKIANDGSGRSIQIGGDAQQIRLSNSAGLVAWCAELHALTSRDDLPLREIRRESFAPEVRIQLIASQLLMFFGELDHSLAIDLGLELFYALWDAGEHDRHTALAVLTLFGCGRVYLRKILQLFFKKIAYRDVKHRNGDLILLMAIAINIKAVEDHPDLATASRLLKPNNKPSIYYRLHREIKDSLGKCHSSPLHRLTSTGDDPIVFAPRLLNTLAATAQVCFAIKAIEYYWIRLEDLEPNELDSIIAKIQGLAESTRLALLDSYKKELTRERQKNAFRIAKKNSLELLGLADQLHARLFVPIGVLWMKDGKPSFLEKSISELAVSQQGPEGQPRSVAFHKTTAWENSNIFKKLFSGRDFGDQGDFYIPWDAEVKEAIREWY